MSIEIIPYFHIPFANIAIPVYVHGGMCIRMDDYGCTMGYTRVEHCVNFSGTYLERFYCLTRSLSNFGYFIFHICWCKYWLEQWYVVSQKFVRMSTNKFMITGKVKIRGGRFKQSSI